jgi:hypothetical protein
MGAMDITLRKSGVSAKLRFVPPVPRVSLWRRVQLGTGTDLPSLYLKDAESKSNQYTIEYLVQNYKKLESLWKEI